MNLPNVGNRIRLRIDKMSIRSGGVGRYNNLVVFVPRSAPEETVLVEIVQVKDQYARGRLVEVVEPSPFRVTPPCPYVTACGGCPWQHISYEEQLRQKQSVVYEQLQKFLKMDLPMLPIFGSPKEFRYRNRVRLKFQEGEFGYFKAKSHQFIPIEDCAIADERLIAEASRWRSKSKNAQEVEFLVTREGALRKTDLREESGTFTQANSEVNAELISTAINWLGETEPTAIVDLYCGEGNFSFPLLQRFPKARLLGVESSAPSIQNAQAHARDLGLTPKQARFHHALVENALEVLPLPPKAHVLLDPPRDGCDPFVMETIANSQPEAVVYVGCHPSSLGRDLQHFFSHAPKSYRIQKVRAFDMFPQTEHVETIVEIRQIP